MSEELHVFLLHGLGGHAVSLLPLELFLNYMGYKNTHKISYPVDYYDTVEESIDYVDKEMSKLVDKEKEHVILIGQSMGGIIINNLHKKGWFVQKSICIGSPLHGANLLNQLEAVLPTTIKNIITKKPYEILKNKEKEEEPPHNYHTISMGWFNSDFDGCVYKEETILNNDNHTHLSWADHRTIFANPRLWLLVHSLIK